jgi:ribosomal protein S5
MMTMMIKLMKSVQLLLFQLVIIVGGQQGGTQLGEGKKHEDKAHICF